MDGVSIHNNNESFRLFSEPNGHFSLISTREGKAKFKLSKVRSTLTCQKGIPYLNTYDGRILRFANPLIKPNDTVKIDLKTNKIVEAIKLDVGSIVMVTGGRNRGCIGVISKREKLKENLEIIHVQNSQGHDFDTNLCHVLTIGKGVIPWNSSKEICGDDDGGNGSQLSESGVSFELPNSLKSSNDVSDSEEEGAERFQRMKGLKDLEIDALCETSFGEVSTIKRKNRRKQLTKVLENSAMLCGDYIDSKCSHNSDSTGLSFENFSCDFDCDDIQRIIPVEIRKDDGYEYKLEGKLYCYWNSASEWQSKGKRKARYKSRTKRRDLGKYLNLNSNWDGSLLKNEEMATSCAIFQKKPNFYSNGFSQLTSVPSQKHLPYRRSRSVVNSKYESSYILGKFRQLRSKLYEVKVEVKEALLLQRNKTIEGEEVPVGVLEDGFCDHFILGTQKSRGLGKHSSKKMRKLSSFTGERTVRRRRCGGQVDKVNACVPLALVFNRIHEALNTKSC